MANDNEENPRLLTFAEAQLRYGSGRYIDLGIINAADVYAAGYIELLPAISGRAILGVRFLNDGFDNSDGQSQLLFTSGNDISLGNGTGFAKFGQDTADSRGISPDIVMGDSGPLGVVSSQLSGSPARFLPWTSNTKFAFNDFVIGSGHAQLAAHLSSEGGTSGSSEPDWAAHFGDVTPDGTIEWIDTGDTTTGWTATIHAIAEVIAIPGLIIPYPASLEWLQQPTDVVAGVAFDPEIQVRALDQNGDLFTLQTFQPDAFVLGNGALTGGNGVQADTENGIATWGNLSMDVSTTPGTYQLIMMIRDSFRSTYFRLASDPFDVTAP